MLSEQLVTSLIWLSTRTRCVYMKSYTNDHSAPNFLPQAIIEEATQVILSQPKLIITRIDLLDRYIKSSNPDGPNFLLPPEHDVLQPIGEKFSKDLQGFIQYILHLRDSFAKNSGEWEQIQAIYRKINTRYIQQQRRERTKRAIKVNKKTFKEKPEYSVRLQWIANIEKIWAKKRLIHLERERSARHRVHLNSDEYNEVLADFWEQVSDEIDRGDYVLPWDFSIEDFWEKENHNRERSE